MCANHPPTHYLFRLQVYRESPHFGRGAVQLLTLIRGGQSLRGACQSLGMAYSKAWHLIKAAEEDLGIELISKKKGGAGRAGSTLSPEGEQMLDRFLAFEAAARRELDRLFEEHFPQEREPSG